MTTRPSRRRLLLPQVEVFGTQFVAAAAGLRLGPRRFKIVVHPLMPG